MITTCWTIAYVYVCYTEQPPMLPSEFEEIRIQMETQTKEDRDELLETYKFYYPNF